jgi:DNA-binding NarL/FixJ family response regulator
MSLRIAIYCCNYLYGEGLRHLLETKGLDIETVLVCTEPQEVFEAGPDLLIIDFSALSYLTFESIWEDKVGILLLETECLPNLEEENLRHFISRGLVGILPRSANSAQLNKAIQSVVSGELWLDRKKVRRVLTNMKAAARRPAFTRREMEVINLVCKGYRNKEVMQHLNLSESSVKSHLKRIYRKAGVSDRLQLTLYIMKYLPHSET